MRIKTGTLFTQYVVTKGDPSSWRMKEKEKVYQRRRDLALRKIDCYCGGDGGGGSLSLSHPAGSTASGDGDRTAL